jgi:hypothetical protein
MEILQRINRFYISLIVVLALLALLAIISLRGVFSAISLASQVDDSLLNSTVPRVNTGKIDEAINSVGADDFVPLDL